MNGFSVTRRRAAALAFCGLALSLGACGDPLVVLGDTPGEVRNVAGVADSAGTVVDSLARRTRFTLASAVAFNDSSGVLYVADRGAVRQISGLTTRIARLFAVTSNGRIQLIMDGGGCAAGAAPCIIEPVSMAVQNRALIIADATGHRVVSFNTATRTFVTLAGNGTAAAASEGAVAAASPILGPAGVVVGPDGLYVSERGADRVWRIDAAGTLVLVAGGGMTEISTSPASAVSVRLRQPSGLAIANGQLYIADLGNNTVEAVDLATGMIRRIAGDGIPGFGGDGGLATEGRLLAPRDVALDPSASLLYIADTGNHRIRAVPLSTVTIRTFMGTGSTVYNGNRLAAGVTALNTPVDLAAAERPFLYVVDQGHNVIRRATLGF